MYVVKFIAQTTLFSKMSAKLLFINNPSIYYKFPIVLKKPTVIPTVTNHRAFPSFLIVTGGVHFV